MLTLQIDLGLGSDTDETEQAATQLRSELLELDVASVERASAGDLPPGAKGVGAVEVGALIVRLVESAGLGAFAAVISAWLERDNNRSIKLQLGEDFLELTGVSSAEQSRLIEYWIMHHDSR